MKRVFRNGIQLPAKLRHRLKTLVWRWRSSHERALVILPREGLANRLRAIASAHIMAEHTGRKLYVNWEPHDELCCAQWTDLFSNTFDEYYLPALFTRSGLRRGVRLYEWNDSRKTYVSRGKDQTEVPDLGTIANDTENVVVVTTCFAFIPTGLTHDEWMHRKAQFYRQLRPIAAIENTVEKIVKDHFQGHEVIGVHIRRKDLANALGMNPIEVSPTSLFIAEMKELIEKKPDARFFLATDSKEEERMMLDHFGERIILYPKESINRNTVRGMQDALVDWVLLAKTSMIISSYWSSFSIESAAVNLIPQRSIHATG